MVLANWKETLLSGHHGSRLQQNEEVKPLMTNGNLMRDLLGLQEWYSSNHALIQCIKNICPHTYLLRLNTVLLQLPTLVSLQRLSDI